MFENNQTPHHTAGISILENDVAGQAIVLEAILKDTSLEPKMVQNAIDLYCGHGIWTAAEASLFTNAHVHAVDYRNTLTPFLHINPRIMFHQGLVVDVIASGALPEAEFVSISFAQERHGFNPSNIHLLHKIAKGYVYTAGDNLDNPLAYEKFFQNSFKLIKYDFISQLWEAK